MESQGGKICKTERLKMANQIFWYRDSLLASLVDGVRASGNLDVHVRMTPTARGKRLGPLEVPVDEEVESMHLKFLQQPPPGWNFAEAIERFNSNVSYSGLLHAVTAEVREGRRFGYE